MATRRQEAIDAVVALVTDNPGISVHEAQELLPVHQHGGIMAAVDVRKITGRVVMGDNGKPVAQLFPSGVSNG